MRVKIAIAAATLAGFIAGLLCVRPVAWAVERLSVTTCSSSGPCLSISNSSSGYGMQAGSAGTGFYSTGGSGYAIDAQAGSGGTAIIATSSAANSKSAAYSAVVSNGASIFLGPGIRIDRHANIFITGRIHTGGSCSSGCSSHEVVQSYGTTAAEPTIEDSGEARLIGGAAFVPLDPKLARAIDPRTSYLVMLTPEGETRGLYVALRSSAGFTVRETLGGHSSLSFAYRIVAHPYGADEPRLPLVEAP